MSVLVVFFDEGCGICNKVRRLLSLFDYKGKCNFKFALDMDFEPTTEAMLKKYYDLYSYDGVCFYKGYDTYMQIFKRNTFLSFFYWLMQLKIVRFYGEKIYRRIADRRACKIELNSKTIITK